MLPNDVTVEGNGRDYLFIRKNCSCTSNKEYLTNTTYTVRVNGGSVHDLVVEAYNGLAFLPDFTREARAGSVVSLQLFCGCSSGLWNYLMSYVMRDGDSVASLASRFGVSMDSIERVNGIENPDNVSVGSLFYIPLNSGIVFFLYFAFLFLVFFGFLQDIWIVRKGQKKGHLERKKTPILFFFPPFLAIQRGCKMDSLVV